MKTSFFYVYILRSEADPPHFYTGFTENLDARLDHHNSGGDPHTAKYRPWRLKTALAFTNPEQALAFEEVNYFSVPCPVRPLSSPVKTGALIARPLYPGGVRMIRETDFRRWLAGRWSADARDSEPGIRSALP